MKKLFRLTSIAFLLLFGLVSCSKIDVDPNKRKSTELLQDIALPIITGTFNMEDILRSDTNSHADFDANGRIWLTYSNKLKSIQAKEMMFNKQNLHSVYKRITAQESSSSYNKEKVMLAYSQDINFDFSSPNNVSPTIDRIYVKEGKLNISFTNNTGFKSSLFITIPSLEKNGTYYRETVELSPNEKINRVIDLADYLITLDNSGSKRNAVKVSLRATFFKPVSMSLYGNIGVTLNFDEDTKYKTLYGDFKKQNLLGQNKSSIDLKLLKGDKASALQFEDFKLGFKWSNSFGIPMKMKIDYINGSNNNGNSFSLDVNNINPNDLIFYAPTNVGDKRNGIVQLDKSNTVSGGGKLNSADFINMQPSHIDFYGTAISNPENYNYPYYKNYVWENSELNMELNTAFLLKGSARDYKFEEVVDMKMGEDVSRVQSATIKMHSINGFPLEFKSFFEFRDQNNALLFTVENDKELFLKSGVVNSLGKVVSPTIQNKEIELTAEQVHLLPNVAKIAVVASFSTTNNGSRIVEISKSNNLVLKLGLRVKYLNEINF